MLDTFLVSDSEKPGRKPSVVSKARDVPDRRRERFLDNIEGHRLILENLNGIGVKLELMAFEQRVPRVGFIVTYGLKEIDL